jgi:hypothetical protein
MTILNVQYKAYAFEAESLENIVPSLEDIKVTETVY